MTRDILGRLPEPGPTQVVECLQIPLPITTLEVQEASIILPENDPLLGADEAENREEFDTIVTESAP